MAGWGKKFPIAVAEVLLSWLRGHGKSGEAILAMLRSEEFLRGDHFKRWRDDLQAKTAKAREIRELLKDYGVDVSKLLETSPSEPAGSRSSSSSDSSSSEGDSVLPPQPPPAKKSSSGSSYSSSSSD
jgi:hypothetical protein